jgi:hypothetical protein
MFHHRMSRRVSNALIFGCVLLALTNAAVAQRHGGGGIASGNTGLSGTSRPTGVDEKDSLKDFHEALAVQATSEQVAEFQALVKNIEAAQTGLQSFLQPLHKQDAPAPAALQSSIDGAVEKARTGSRNFEDGFSSAQKSGLKDIAKRLAKADAVLEQEQKAFDQNLALKASNTEIAAHGESLDKALTDFYNQQLILGRAMSITLATGQDVAFTLPPEKRAVPLENRTIAVTVSGALSQVGVKGDQRTFKLEVKSDLSDVQQNITELLRGQLNTSEACGQRLAIQQATFAPAAPASLVLVRLHFERWICNRSVGQQTPSELAEGDGTVEIKLTTSVDPSSGLKIVPSFGRIDATGMLAESLRSGSLGEDLRDKVAATVLSAARAGSDFKTALPTAIQNSATVQGARFQTLGVGGVSIVLEGQVEMSSAQADQLAKQLNQTLSAQGSAGQ